MAKARWPSSWHGRLGAIVSVFGALVTLRIALDFGAGYNGTDVNAILVIAIVGVTAIVILTILGDHFDRTYATAGFFEAFARMLPPIAVLSLGGAWLMNLGIFAGSQFAFVGVGIGSATAVFVTRYLVNQLHGSAPEASPLPDVIVTPERNFLDGPPQWTAAPPAASRSAATATANDHVDSASAGSVVQPRRPWAHRITSGLIALVWLPLGFVVWFAANWCPDDGTAEAVFVTSTIYVLVQILVNPLAGWLLDRRYAAAGGTGLAVGRSLLVAIVLVVAVGFFLSLFVPDGPSNYCG